MTPLDIQNFIEGKTINVALPAFNQGDTIALKFTAYAGQSDSNKSIVPTSDYSIKLGIYSSDGTQLALQTSFTADSSGEFYTGTLGLNDAAMQTAVAAATPSAPITAYFTVQIINGSANPWTSYGPAEVKIFKQLISPASTTVSPGLTALSVEEAAQIFVKQDGTSGPFILKSATKKWLITIDDNGQLHPNQVS